MELARRKLSRGVSLMTFNILAPCYFRHGGRLESDDRTAFLARANAVIHSIQREQSDLICLQEYWFNREYQQVFRNAFQNTHYLHGIKRPGAKEDGLAIFVEKKKFDIHHVHHIEFDNAGDRVALMMHIATKWNRNEASLHERSFLLINSHLTFPHCDIYKDMRLSQIRLVLESIQKYVGKEKLHDAPVLMCGDFNDFNDPVHDMVMDHGFDSVFSQVHGREARITHCNHNNREVGVDFIFAANLKPKTSSRTNSKHPLKRLKLLPTRCDLLPRNLPDGTRLKRPSFGHDWETVDHTYDRSEEEIVNYWRMVSDHRPLVATFDVLHPRVHHLNHDNHLDDHINHQHHNNHHHHDSALDNTSSSLPSSTLPTPQQPQELQPQEALPSSSSATIAAASSSSSAIISSL